MDLPLIITLVLSILTFLVYLLPRWHRKRTIELPIIRTQISVVGPLRQWTLRILFTLIYSFIILLVLREIYVTRANCETSDGTHLLTLATQSRVLRFLNQIDVPVWVDHETLGDYLYTNYGLPKWKSTVTFSTLWTDQKGLEYIRNIITTNEDNTSTGLWTQWYVVSTPVSTSHHPAIFSASTRLNVLPTLSSLPSPTHLPRRFSSTSTLRVGFHGLTTVYLDLVFWYDQYDAESNGRFLMTPSPIFDFPLVHYYDVFPLQQRPPREYPQTPSRDQNLVLHPGSINIPNSAHALAMRNWGDLAKEGDFRKTPARSVCMDNLLSLRWISFTSSYSPHVLQELKYMGIEI